MYGAVGALTVETTPLVISVVDVPIKVPVGVYQNALGALVYLPPAFVIVIAPRASLLSATGVVAVAVNHVPVTFSSCCHVPDPPVLS